MVNFKKTTQSIALIVGSFLFLFLPLYSVQAYEQQEIILDPDQKLQDNTKLGGYAEDPSILSEYAPEWSQGTGDAPPAGPVLIAALIINLLLGVLGVFSLMLIVYGGFIWMLARGNEEEVKKAKDIITGTVLGLVVILSSYSFMRFIFEAIIRIAN